MIIHSTRKLSQRLPNVTKEHLAEDSPLGGWHADRLTLDRKQWVHFCHVASRAALFAAGLRKRLLYAETADG
jgi:signal transduction protein with GAF and PtsI domain